MTALTDTDLKELKDLINGRFSELDRKIETKFNELDRKIDINAAVTNEKFNSIHEKFNSVNGRFTAIDRRLDTLQAGVNKTLELNEKISPLEGRVESIQGANCIRPLLITSADHHKLRDRCF